MRAVALVPALLLAAACTHFQLAAPTEDLEFDLIGRLAARYSSESFSGGLAWRHARKRDDLLISTPLGQGVARIVREGAEVVLSTAEPKEYRAPDAETLTEQVLGFRLPLHGLSDWVRARPAPGSEARVDKGPDGRVRAIEQLGWKVEYQEYAGERPSRLRLTYPDIELRLVISQWN